MSTLLSVENIGISFGGLRAVHDVSFSLREGEILSGTFAPTIGKSIALARIPAGEPGEVRVDIRGREVPVRVVAWPFVRDGQPREGI